MSVWVAAAVVGVEAWQLRLGWLFAVLLGLTSSSVTGLVAQHEPE
jgi:hypothetical protein